MECKTFTAQTYVKPMYDGHCAFISNLTSIPHSHDYYEAFFVLNGTAKHIVNDTALDLTRGSVVLIRLGDIHAYIAEDCQIFNIILTVDLMEKIVGFLGLDSIVSDMLAAKVPIHRDLPPSGYESMLLSFEQFMFTPHPDPQSYNIGLRLIAVNFFEKLLYNKNTSQHSTYPTWLHILITEMQKEKNYAAGLNAMYNISMYTPEYLCRIFQRHLQMTPTQLLNQIRIKEASKRLIYTELPIVDISEQIGYESLSHFYHQFKKHFGTSPLRYRQDHRLNPEHSE